MTVANIGRVKMMNSKFIIPEGSKVLFELHGVGSIDTIKKVETHVDVMVESNAILIIDSDLYCTDIMNPVEKVSDEEFKINIWLQDAHVVENDYFYESVSDID